MTNSLLKRAVDKTRRWLKGQIVEEVPDELARCEFTCRKSECRMGEWATCQKRLTEAQDARDFRAQGGENS